MKGKDFMKMKKFWGLVLFGVTFFVMITSASASLLSIDSVSRQFNLTSKKQGFTDLGSNVYSVVNTADKTLDIYNGDKEIVSFSYTDEYIEYDNRSMIVTENNYLNLVTSTELKSVIDTILLLSGYGIKNVSSDTIDDNYFGSGFVNTGDSFIETYDAFGIRADVGEYEVSGETNSDNGHASMIWSTAGKYIIYFKMSLDTDSFDRLMASYIVDEEEENRIREIKSITPILETEDVTEDSVTIYPSINYTPTDSKYNVICYIYRSDSENGTYELINDFAVSCLDSVGVVDTGLKSDTTYYYKTVVSRGTIYSNPIKVTTKSSSNDTQDEDVVIDENTADTTNTTENSGVENPKTGVSIPIIAVSTLLLGGLGIIYYTKKKNKFTKI